MYELTSLSSQPVWFFKEDLDRAFRQIFCCLSSVPLMGFRWRNLYYFDLVMVMGCRIAPYICQRVTNMITYLHCRGGFHLLNYVDDFLGAEYWSKITQSHESFKILLEKIGAARSEKKSIPPTQVIEWVGTLFNANNMTIGITQARKVDLMYELNKWRFKTVTTRRELESLVGKLQFVSNCV